MKYIFTLCLFSITIYTVAQNGQVFADKLDEKYGFRDVKLESSFTSMTRKQLILKETSGKLKVYTSKTEDLKIGDFKLSAIHYFFYDGSLMQIMIKTKGLVNSDGVLKILQTSYGRGFKANDYIDQYMWDTDKTSIFYDQNSITDDAVITISSKIIEAKKDQDEEASGKQAAEKDF